MSKALILVGGGKGGVGKSLFSMAVVDFLESTREAPFLIETDTSVPDVFKTYRETIEGELVQPRRTRGVDRARESRREQSGEHHRHQHRGTQPDRYYQLR